MDTHIIVGASAVGKATAILLAEKGKKVKLITRTASGPVHPNIEKISADATNVKDLTRLAEGSAVIYNCASPPYDKWPAQWPALGASFIEVAERTGAVLASYSNLYGYGKVNGPMSEDTPLIAEHPKLRVRAELWKKAYELHLEGRIRVTEIRSSDHFQPNSMFSLALCKPLLEGKLIASPIPLDVPRSWTSVSDAAKLLVKVAEEPDAWGKAWHVPTNEPITARELLFRFAEINGLKKPKPIQIPYSVIWTAGMFVPMLRELRTTMYQFEAPYVINSSAATNKFGLTPEPIDEALLDTADKLRNEFSY
ncbi:MAG TPA: NAD-dependent epimerase/dehydratase family protein [Pseudosphingobacterium sp.]|nr:NAD-dependent epimerase/dehydratase family protein [Pseudosphingobacterium sp.]